MKIKNGLLLLFAVVLTFSGCSNSSTQGRTETDPAEQVSKTDYERMMDDLNKIDGSMTGDQVCEILGTPDQSFGSGILYERWYYGNCYIQITHFTQPLSIEYRDSEGKLFENIGGDGKSFHESPYSFDNTEDEQFFETKPSEQVAKTDYERMMSDLGKIDSSFSKEQIYEILGKPDERTDSETIYERWNYGDCYIQIESSSSSLIISYKNYDGKLFSNKGEDGKRYFEISDHP